jgi:hypothetical protein
MSNRTLRTQDLRALLAEADTVAGARASTDPEPN